MAESADPRVGQVLGGYRVLELLASRGTGSTYRAVQLSVDRDVVLKLLDPEMSEDPRSRAVFLEVARSAAKLSHPNVAKVHNVGEEGGLLFYSMEHLPGGSLAALLESRRRLPWERGCAWFQDAARALHYAEDNRVVHGNLRPNNLLLTQDGRLKVVDLGMAPYLLLSQQQGKRRSPAACLYMAPEQMAGGKADQRSDIYSLGCVFQHLFSRNVPFDGVSVKLLYDSKVKGAPAPLSRLVHKVPSWFAELLHRMMSPRPDERPQSFGEVLRILAQHGLEAGSAPTGGAADPGDAGGVAREQQESSKGRQGAGALLRSRGGKVGIVAAVLVLLLGSVAAFLASRGSGDTPLTDPRASVSGSGSGSGSRMGPASGPGPGRPGKVTPSSLDAGGVAQEGQEGQRDQGDRSAHGSDASSDGGLDNAAIGELAEIKKNWTEKLIDLQQATRAIELVKDRHPSPLVETAAGNLLKLLGEEASLSRELERSRMATREEAQLAKVITSQIQPQVDRKRYSDAITALEALRASYPRSAARIDQEIARVEGMAKEEVALAADDVTRLTQAGDFTRAENLLDDLQLRVPEKLHPEVEKMSARAASARQEFLALEGKVEAAMQSVEAQLSAFRFEGIEESLRAQAPGAHPLLAARLEALAEEIQLLRETAESLVEGVERRISTGETAEYAMRGSAPAPGGGEGTKVSLRLKALEDGFEGRRVLVVQRKDGKLESLDLLDLSNADLLALIQSPRSGGEVISATRAAEGLILLCLHARGPESARSLLDGDSGLSPEAKSRHGARIPEVGKALALAKKTALSGGVALLERKSPAATAEEWGRLQSRILSLFAEHGRLPYFAQLDEDFKSLYIRAAVARHRSEGIEGLFHARRVKLGAGGAIELLYDFTTEDQLEAFSPVGSPRIRTLDRNSLKLNGECRLLHGDPFKTRLEIGLDVVQYNVARANINVALWTRETDTVTYSSDWVATSASAGTTGTTEAPEGSGAGSDYLVFGLGYDIKSRNSSSSSLSTVTLTLDETNQLVGLPAHVILGGSHGKPVHFNYLWKCLWAEGSLNKLRGPQHLQLLLTPDTFHWTANRDNLSQRAFRRAPEAVKGLQKEGASGSITLFTNGETVQFGRLKVEGELSAGWVDRELERLATLELQRARSLPGGGSARK